MVAAQIGGAGTGLEGFGQVVADTETFEAEAVERAWEMVHPIGVAEAVANTWAVESVVCLLAEPSAKPESIFERRYSPWWVESLAYFEGGIRAGLG